MTPLPLADVASDALSGVAAALELPVHVLALLLLLLLALELGRATTELWRRRGPGARPLWWTARAAVAEPARGADLARAAPTAVAGRAVAAIADALRTGRPGDVEHALTAYELGVQRRLDGTRLLVRAGPALGLMGTLIPLAPGLEALGQGDIGSLADDLRAAFAATVVGLLVGTVAFALTLVRTRVYTEDLAALERAVAEVAAGDGPPPAAVPVAGIPTVPAAAAPSHAPVPTPAEVVP